MEVSAEKQKNREKDYEPTEEDYGGDNMDMDDGGEGDAGRKRVGGKKRRRGADAPASSRGDDIERLKKGFLGSVKSGVGAGNAGPVAASAQDFVQPKKKAGKSKRGVGVKES